MPEHCFECEKGRLVEIVQDYTDVGPDGASVVVPGVTFLRCTDCGEEFIPAESNRYISRYVAEANEQLTKADLFAMLESSGLSQKDFAEAIGLGEKTVHRWLKGTQVVSRSMGYYLRAMQAFPQVFDWIKSRPWREPAPAPARPRRQERPRFAALERREKKQIVRIRLKPGSNPARQFNLDAVL